MIQARLNAGPVCCVSEHPGSNRCLQLPLVIPQCLFPACHPGRFLSGIFHARCWLLVVIKQRPSSPRVGIGDLPRNRRLLNKGFPCFITATACVEDSRLQPSGMTLMDEQPRPRTLACPQGRDDDLTAKGLNPSRSFGLFYF